MKRNLKDGFVTDRRDEGTVELLMSKGSTNTSPVCKRVHTFTMDLKRDQPESNLTKIKKKSDGEDATASKLNRGRDKLKIVILS